MRKELAATVEHRNSVGEHWCVVLVKQILTGGVCLPQTVVTKKKLQQAI